MLRGWCGEGPRLAALGSLRRARSRERRPSAPASVRCVHRVLVLLPGLLAFACAAPQPVVGPLVEGLLEVRLVDLPAGALPQPFTCVRARRAPELSDALTNVGATVQLPERWRDSSTAEVVAVTLPERPAALCFEQFEEEGVVVLVLDTTRGEVAAERSAHGALCLLRLVPERRQRAIVLRSDDTERTLAVFDPSP